MQPGTLFSLSQKKVGFNSKEVGMTLHKALF